MKRMIVVRTLIYRGNEDWVQRALTNGFVPAIGTKHFNDDTSIQSSFTVVERFDQPTEPEEPEFPEGSSSKWEKKFLKHQPTLYAKALELTSDELFGGFNDTPVCNVEHPKSMYLCSRLSGHTGKHIASTGDQICAIWSDQEE